MLAIYIQLQVVVDAQRRFREKIEKRKERQMVILKVLTLNGTQIQVEREWNRIFSRFDYFFLFVFSLGNLAILLLFLRYM